MHYKYTIIQENTNDKSKVTLEFDATDEDAFVENVTSFMHMVGWNDGGHLEIVNTDSLYDDIDSEVSDTIDWKDPEIESYKNFEFPLDKEGGGQMDYTFTSSDMDSIVDRPSQPTYRVDSIYETNANVSYYGV